MSTLLSVPRLQASVPRHVPGAEFRAVATQALIDVRSSFKMLLAGLRQPVRHGGDAQRALGLGKVLAWQVFRLSNAENPLTAAPFVPRSEALGKILAAASQNGVAEPVIHKVEAACAAFEVVVREHAGSRSAFESMIETLDGPKSGEKLRSLRDRRAAFRASSNLWGISAYAKVTCAICFPTADGQSYDLLQVWGSVGVRQLRAGVNLHLSTVSFVLPDSIAASKNVTAESEEMLGAPIDPQAVGLLDQFCTHPLPRLFARDAGNGRVRVGLELQGIGRSSAINYFVRRVAPAALKRESGPHYMSCGVTTPTEYVIIDLLVPAGHTDPGSSSAAAYGRVDDMQQAHTCEPRDLLPFSVSNTYLGSSIADLHISEAPQYPAMLQHLIQEQGWQGTAFDVYRCQMEYPLLHSVIRTSVAGVE